MTGGPLDGIRVVEFGNLIAGPYAGMLLADLGADVVKVEPPSGDLGRSFGPYVVGESAFFMAVNRGKRSVCLSPKDPDARRWLGDLVASADVLLHNLRLGAMERMGLGEEDVRRINPAVIYTVVSAFGADGPYADRAGIDVVFQGESGMMSITGEPGSPPAKTATTIGDYVAATNAALAVCAALVERAATGRGRRVDVSLRDGLMAVQSGWNAVAFATGRQPAKTGTASPFLAPNQAFETADGHLTLAIVSDAHFLVLCRELGRLDLADRYPTNGARMQGRAELVAELEAVFRSDLTSRWVERLGAAGLPVGRVLTLPEVWHDPQVTHNEMVVEYDHPVAGRVRGIGSPLRLDGAPARASDPPPALGQHTAAVLAELGATDQEIAELIGDPA
ncbi:MAG: CoA transferase [Acidimicrobiia bacterium]|jgi:crotonobetainyl-CoA:carnitine CoA-transferase CaiB-like acyl-CoA transferase